MDVISVFGVISGIIILGFIAEIIFKKTNIPDVLILLFIGIMIGSVLNWATVDNFGESSKLFTTFALIFILFQGALSINFKTIFESLSSATKLTFLTFFSTAIIVTLLTYLVYDNWYICLLFGFILGGTSSAVVIPIVNNINMKEKYKLVMILESAITDVLCIVGALTVLQIINTGDVIASQVFKTIFSSFSLAIVSGVILGFIWIFLLNKFEILINSYILTVAMVIGLYAFVESSYVGASGAIAALTFGLILGNSKTLFEMFDKHELIEANRLIKHPNHLKLHKEVLSHSAKSFYSEISFFVKTFFFVYLGIMIDFSNLLVFIYAFLIVITIYLIRPVIIRFIFREESHLERQDRVLMEILAPKGLAAAVLAGLAVQSGLLGEYATNFVNLVLAVVLISIIFSAILVYFSKKEWFNGLVPSFKLSKPSSNSIKSKN